MRNQRSLFVSITFLLSAILLFLVYYIGITYDIPFERLMGDPANYFKFHPLTGIVSYLGVILWCTSATICLFSGIILMNKGKKKQRGKFLIFTGILTAILLIDDLFMLHDFLFYSKGTFYLEIYFYGIYGALVLYLLMKYRELIMRGNYFLLLSAILFFGLSILLDVLLPSEGHQYLVEDSLKFLGIVSWMLFFSGISFDYIVKD